MEIERKWLVNGWPDNLFPGLPMLEIQEMRQGYISVEPTVRIREEKKLSGAPCGETGASPETGTPAGTDGSVKADYILCFKSGGGIAREEIEFPISEENFKKLERLIGFPLVPKTRKTYLLADGCHLEVNWVDAGADTAFWYAEIEYASVEEAKAWRPQEAWLSEYLSNEVTETPGYSMGAYWIKTRE